MRNEYIGGLLGWRISARCVDCGMMLIAVRDKAFSYAWVRPTCDDCNARWDAKKWNT